MDRNRHQGRMADPRRRRGCVRHRPDGRQRDRRRPADQFPVSAAPHRPVLHFGAAWQRPVTGRAAAPRRRIAGLGRARPTGARHHRQPVGLAACRRSAGRDLLYAGEDAGRDPPRRGLYHPRLRRVRQAWRRRQPCRGTVWKAQRKWAVSWQQAGRRIRAGPGDRVHLPAAFGFAPADETAVRRYRFRTAALPG